MSGNGGRGFALLSATAVAGLSLFFLLSAFFPGDLFSFSPSSPSGLSGGKENISFRHLLKASFLPPLLPLLSLSHHSLYLYPIVGTGRVDEKTTALQRPFFSGFFASLLSPRLLRRKGGLIVFTRPLKLFFTFLPRANNFFSSFTMQRGSSKKTRNLLLETPFSAY